MKRLLVVIISVIVFAHPLMSQGFCKEVLELQETTLNYHEEKDGNSMTVALFGMGSALPFQALVQMDVDGELTSIDLEVKIAGTHLVELWKDLGNDNEVLLFTCVLKDGVMLLVGSELMGNRTMLLPRKP